MFMQSMEQLGLGRRTYSIVSLLMRGVLGTDPPIAGGRGARYM